MDEATLREILTEFPDGTKHDLVLLLLEIKKRSMSYRTMEDRNVAIQDYSRAAEARERAQELESLYSFFRSTYGVNRLNLEEVTNHDRQRGTH